jgi:hypothetical protein
MGLRLAASAACWIVGMFTCAWLAAGFQASISKFETGCVSPVRGFRLQRPLEGVLTKAEWQTIKAQKFSGLVSCNHQLMLLKSAGWSTGWPHHRSTSNRVLRAFVARIHIQTHLMTDQDLYLSAFSASSTLNIEGCECVISKQQQPSEHCRQPDTPSLSISVRTFQKLTSQKWGLNVSGSCNDHF